MSREYTEEQKQAYYKRELTEISQSGDEHSAYVISSISGLGFQNIGPVDPPVVGFGQSNDPYYQQYLHNWDEVDALIKDIEDAAMQAWGSRPIKTYMD